VISRREDAPKSRRYSRLNCDGEDIVPIPGTRRIAWLEENAAAATLKLTTEELQRIDGVLRQNEVAGTRYVAAGMALVNADTAARRPT